MAASVLVFLFGGITMLLSRKLPLGTLRAPGSGLFPLSLGLILMGLAAGHILQLSLARRKLATGPEGQRGPAGSAQRVLLFMGAVGIATALLEPLGYLLVSFLLMLALLHLLGMRGWQVSLVIAVVTAGASYVLFVRWLQIPLPAGWIGL